MSSALAAPISSGLFPGLRIPFPSGAILGRRRLSYLCMRYARAQLVISVGAPPGCFVAVAGTNPRCSGTKNGPGNRGHFLKKCDCGSEGSMGRARGALTLMPLFRGRNAGGRHCGRRCGCFRSRSGQRRRAGGGTGCWRGRSRSKQSWTSGFPFLKRSNHAS